MEIYIYPLADMLLIDTWWNVNLDVAKFEEKCKTVLIDTWWNVNMLKANDTSAENSVLIDTWWNVNNEII